jgi:hypothetical protein
MILLLTFSDNEGQEDDDFDGQGNECDAVSCSSICLLGCAPATSASGSSSGTISPTTCSGDAARRCGTGWEALPGDLGCQR